MEEPEIVFEKLSDWCQRKIDAAKSGEEAYNYYELKQMWLGRNL
jgi:hypothetical protein